MLWFSTGRLVPFNITTVVPEQSHLNTNEATMKNIGLMDNVNLLGALDKTTHKLWTTKYISGGG